MLRQLMRPCDVISPDIPIDPTQALEMLNDICIAESPDLIVGLSWGGFLAQKLRGRRKVLVNPDFHVSALMRSRIGVMDYLSPRRDGEKSFNIDEALCQAYERLEYTQFDGLDEAERAITLGIFADADELVHCGPEFSGHYPGRAISYHGGHLPTYPEMKFQIIPAIREFSK